jgi:hypothetical protein
VELVTRQRAQSLIDANLASPLEYQSADDTHVTFRLKDGNTFRLTGEQATSSRVGLQPV